MILNDHQIRELLVGCITPFFPDKITVADSCLPALSYGTGGHGYDLRLGYQARVLRPDYSTPLAPRAIDPKRMRDDHFVTIKTTWEGGEHVFYVQPGQLFLGVSQEHLMMPANVMGVVVGKSTYARSGLIVNATPIEAGWCGFLTIELANTTHIPIKVYAGEGIAQVLFFAGDAAVAPYNGKYQHQPCEPVIGRVQ